MWKFGIEYVDLEHSITLLPWTRRSDFGGLWTDSLYHQLLLFKYSQLIVKLIYRLLISQLIRQKASGKATRN